MDLYVFLFSFPYLQFFYYQTNDRAKVIRQFQVKDTTRLLSVVKRFLKEMRTRSEQNVVLQCL